MSVVHIKSELCRYLIIGGATTLVNYVLFLILCYLTPMGNSNTGITLANIISIFAAILFAYFANKYVVFKSQASGIRELIYEMVRFIAARLSTMAIEVTGVFLIVSVAGREPFIGKMLVQILVVIGNYFISRYLVFRTSYQENQSDTSE